MWFAQQDKVLVGMIGLLSHANATHKHRSDILSFWVKPAYRGKGIGAALVRYI